LGLESPLVFETKATSMSRDLFYTFDNLRRFQAAHAAERDLDPRGFIQFNALGLAILRTLPWEEIVRVAPPDLCHAAPGQSVVLIDEIDKAPRDFPNDILNELEHLYFRIPELGGEVVRANPVLRPIVIMTSNSEKSLPDAFLRRCIFYHIPFPNAHRLEEIVLARVVGLSSDSACRGLFLADLY
jgi:AAA domain (dynein-related subfamily)